MYRAREKNASSTLMFDFAEVSMNGMPSSWASALPCSSETTRFSVQSHLFPIRILWTPSVACCSTFWNHVRISAGKRVSNRFNIDGGYTIEGPLITDVINQEDSHCTAIVSCMN